MANFRKMQKLLDRVGFFGLFVCWVICSGCLSKLIATINMQTGYYLLCPTHAFILSKFYSIIPCRLEVVAVVVNEYNHIFAAPTIIIVTSTIVNGSRCNAYVLQQQTVPQKSVS